jgi:hypothetical protein
MSPILTLWVSRCLSPRPKSYISYACNAFVLSQGARFSDAGIGIQARSSHIRPHTNFLPSFSPFLRATFPVTGTLQEFHSSALYIFFFHLTI